MTEPRDVLLVGATGVVGRELALLLSQDPAVGRLHLVVRKLPLPDFLEKLPNTNLVVCEDFTKLSPESLPTLPSPHAVFIALGTTLRQVKGDRAAFREVDFGHVVRTAKAAAHWKSSFVGVVSSAGAAPRSPVFYNQVKGEMEEALRALSLPSLVIARPGLLLGDRAERRPGEEWAKRLLPCLFPPLEALFPSLSRVRPVEPKAVAQSLVKAWHASKGSHTAPEVRILEGKELTCR